MLGVINATIAVGSFRGQRTPTFPYVATNGTSLRISASYFDNLCPPINAAGSSVIVLGNVNIPSWPLFSRKCPATTMLLVGPVFQDNTRVRTESGSYLLFSDTLTLNTNSSLDIAAGASVTFLAPL